jgi:predicted DsbA family dithiol-disulfide isomerase
MQVIVISDYVCPWCYIGMHRVKQMEQEYEIDVQWWPYELHPETPLEGRRVEEIFGQRGQAYEEHRQRLKQYAADSDIELASNRVVANSHKALEMSEYARDEGRFEEVHEALFRAYFAEAKNIGDMEVLLDIAVGAGLGREATREVLESSKYSAQIDEMTAMARQNGYTSTPTMIFGNRTYIPGAQDIEVYRNVLDKLEVPRRNGS